MMAENFVAKVSDLKDGERRIVFDGVDSISQNLIYTLSARGTVTNTT
jgi:hypothetical protein